MTADTNYYAKWYDANKTQLADKRRDRYANDPEYRAKMLKNRAKYTEKKRVELLSTLPDAYTTTFSEAAEKLKITLWRLRNWRSNKYFPEPYQHGKCLYFTDDQMFLLEKLNEFMGDKPRLSRDDVHVLDDLTNFIFSNW